MTLSASEWQSAVLMGRFTPVSSHLPDVPAGAEDFFRRAFELEPARRPDSVRTFVSGLERVMT